MRRSDLSVAGAQQRMFKGREGIVNQLRGICYARQVRRGLARGGEAVQGRRLRLGLLSGWPWDIARGSGTARFLIDLERALLAESVDLIRIDSDLDPADYRSFVARRLEWNRTLGNDPRLERLDAVLALDYDGVDLPQPPLGPVKIVCPQAVFADLAETEPEPYRGLLLLQAEAEGRNARSAPAVIVPSRYAANGVTRAYGIAPDRIAVIPHGFDRDGWSAMVTNASARGAGAESAIPASRDGRVRTILAVSKLYPRKGIDLLIEAAAILRRSRPSLRLRIVGGGIDGERLHRLAADLGVSDMVRFEGDMENRHSVARCYAEADLFCLPSRHETFGFAFVEAMAAGLPVVALDAGAAPEVVGDAGVLVRAGDPIALAEAIAEILDSPSLARRLGEKGRARSAAFDWPTTARRYIEVVRRVIGSRRGEVIP
jgi:glycosyltransferase involved in cell wall biosynthesis